MSLKGNAIVMEKNSNLIIIIGKNMEHSRHTKLEITTDLQIYRTEDSLLDIERLSL